MNFWFYNQAMQFLSISRRRTDAFPAEAFTPELVGGEAQRAKELYASGVLRQIWKRGDAPGAAIIWEAASEAEARGAIASLPLAKAGMLEITTFLALEPYAGFVQ
jgi:muconolactone delta-isomerase